MKTIFIRLIDEPDKASALRLATVNSENYHAVDVHRFSQLPKSPFAYWASNGLFKAFESFEPLEGEKREARRGAGASDDARYLRLSWEVSYVREHRLGVWVPYAKGGNHSKYYSDVPLLVDWEPRRRTFFAFFGRPGRQTTRPEALDFYFRAGLTWPRRTTSGIGLRVLPVGCIFGEKGPTCFVKDDKHAALLALLGLTNSSAFASLVAMQLAAADAAARSYEVGVIQRTPVPELSSEDESALGRCALAAWSLKRSADTRAETSHAFVLPAVLQAECDSLQSRAQAWTDLSGSRQQEIAAIQGEIDDRCFALYGIGFEDRRSIEAGFGPTEASDEPDDEDSYEDDSLDDEVDAGPMVASLLSWSLGVAFGRFDLRVASGDHPLPPEPDPFDPLPVCSPGMLTGGDGLPVAAPPAGYPLPFPTDGILVDDPGHSRDLLKAVRAVFDEVFDDANARWHEAAELVGARGGDLRDWFARTFFGEHIKRYSKSRRKAPIYWQLATSSGSYSVWVYIHRATPDTLFRVLNDFVGPKLDHEREKLDRLTRDAGPNPSRTDRDALAAQESFVDELQALRAEVARVAPLWKPDLDDGVILNFAPLWRLVPHERSWQTECRKAWDKQCAGEYDWAHLAMHLWPERVVPKCTEDRSLAIAHGLEDVFWREDGSGNWHAVDVAEATLRQLVEERTSSSVKAALKDLLAAPAPTGKSGGRRAPSAPARAPAPRRAAPAGSAPARSSTAEVDEATLTAVRVAIAAVAEGASKADVQATTGLSDADWNRAIAVLLERGDVTRTGQKRGTRYHANNAGGAS